MADHLEQSPKKQIWVATVFSALGSSILYGIDSLTRVGSQAPVAPVAAVIGSAYVIGFFSQPAVCDEVDGVKTTATKEGYAGIGGKSELHFPEDPEADHNRSVVSALSIATLNLGLNTWLLASTDSVAIRWGIGASMLAPFVVAFFNRDKFKYKPVNTNQASISPTFFIRDKTYGVGLSFNF